MTSIGGAENRASFPYPPSVDYAWDVHAISSGGVFSASGAPIAFGSFSVFAGALGVAGASGGSDNWSVDVQIVPEPGTAFLVAIGLIGLSAQRRRRTRIR